MTDHADTRTRIVSAAAKVLTSKSATKAQKSVAASALTQREPTVAAIVERPLKKLRKTRSRQTS